MKAKAKYYNFSFMTFVVMKSEERMTFDIIRRRHRFFIFFLFTIFCYHLGYGHLTYSSVQCFPYME